MLKHTEPMKHLHLQIDEDTYRELCRFLPSYGERSIVIRKLLRQAVRELRNESDMPPSKAISQSAKRLARQVESHGTKSEERGAA